MADDSDDRSPQLRAYFITVTVLTVVAISARFAGRMLIERGQRFWWDDWAALASVPTIFALNAICLTELEYGMGRHIWTIPEDDVGVFLKLFWVSYFAYDLALWATKSAAILFLSRVFPKFANEKWFNWAIWGTHGLNTAWLLGTVFSTLFFCDPIAKNWNSTLDGSCGDTPTLMMGSAISSVIIDLIILLLPLPKIWRLKLDVAKKSGLMGVFVVGYLVVVVSVGRLVTVLNSGDKIDRDLSWEIAPAMYWFLAEAPVTLLCICLPACLPILRRMFSRWVSPVVTRASGYLQSGHSRSNKSGSRSRSDETGGREEDEDAINIDKYPKDRSPGSSAQTMEIGRAFGGRESPDSDESNRGILGREAWEAPGLGSGGTSATASTGRRPGQVPDWSIRVDKDIRVQQQSKW